jgi:hypothetical protein
MIISLSGKKLSGKSSVAAYLVNKHGFVEVSWAAPLKEIIGKQLFRFSHDQLYDPIQKEVIDPRWGMSPRDILQKVGTDLFRNNLMDDFWVRIGVETIKEEIAKGNHVVLSDTRFPNELKAIEDLGGKTIRLKRSDVPSTDPHYSENALDEATFEYDIAAITGELPSIFMVMDSIVSSKDLNVVPSAV